MSLGTEPLDSTFLPAADRASPVAVVVIPVGLLFIAARLLVIPAGDLFIPAGPMPFVREGAQFGRHVGQGLPPFVLMPFRGSQGTRGKYHSLG